MPFIDHFFAIGAVRKAIWKHWYPFLTRRLGGAPVIFLNYAYEEDPPMGIPLPPGYEADRGCAQLYHHVASQTDLEGKSILEVSCGHGGGASYVTRALKPKRATALDLNPEAIRFCRERHISGALEFVVGDAERLPFPDDAFDAVINVEASHCYPDFPRFLSETARVLKPGGRLLYADFRFKEAVPAWEAAFAASPLKTLGTRDISPQVLRGMEMNSGQSLRMVERFLPGFLHGLGRDFAGVKGSRVYEALKRGEVVYRSYLCEKRV